MDSRVARRHRRVLVCVALSVLLVGVLVGPVSSVTAQESAANATDSDGSEIPRHRNPVEISAEGDLQQLEAVLRGSLDGQLAVSADNLDQDDYDQARAALGASYDRNLSRYRELAVQLDTSELAEQYAAAQTDQQAYIEAVERYETTRAEYDQARRAGDDERARALARNLAAAADEVDRNGRRLTGRYQRLGNETGQEYTDQVDGINAQRTEATETRETVSSTEFTETTLSATAAQSRVAFTDRLRITGRLQTADGEPLETQQARIAIQDQRYTVDLAGDGSFELTAAPDSVWETADQLAVRYVPPRSSAYLSANTTLSVTVETTETAVTVASVSEPVSYDESLDIGGTVTTAESDQPVPAVPVVLRIDGTRVGTTETATDGGFSFGSDLPAIVSAGNATAIVRLQPGPLAVEAAEGRTGLTVEPTDTVVSVTATVVQESAEELPIEVRGSVESAGGRPIAGTPVTVRIDGAAVGEVETDSDGAFSEQFTAPAATDRSEPLVVEAAFDGQGSNLEAASGSTTVEPPVSAPGAAGRLYGPLGIGLSVVGGLGLLAAVGWWLRRPSTGAGTTAADPGLSGEIEAVQNQELLTAAADQLEDGAAESAALLAYATVRRQLASEVSVSETATHWEWYRGCVAAGVDQLSELQTLVEAFEQVTFAPDSDESAAAASRAVSTARQVVEDEN